MCTWALLFGFARPPAFVSVVYFLLCFPFRFIFCFSLRSSVLFFLCFHVTSLFSPLDDEGVLPKKKAPQKPPKH